MELKGLVKLAKYTDTGWYGNRPQLKQMLSNVHDAKSAQSAVNHYYSLFPKERNMTYTNPRTGKKSKGNPYLSSLVKWKSNATKKPAKNTAKLIKKEKSYKSMPINRGMRKLRDKHSIDAKMDSIVAKANGKN